MVCGADRSWKHAVCRRLMADRKAEHTDRHKACGLRDTAVFRNPKVFGPRYGHPLQALARGSRRVVAALSLVFVLGPGNALTEPSDPLAMAADVLLAAQTAEGLFEYDFNFVRSGPSGRHSIVRQAGTAYALAEAYGYNRDHELRIPVRRALNALRLLSVEVGGDIDGGALISHDRTVEGTKVGATALALLTELFYYRTSGDGRFEQVRQVWLRGLLALRRPGAGFRRSVASDLESPYYNGETWLALALYALTFEAPTVHAVLADVDNYMMAKYGGAPEIGFFHWGLMAAELRWRATGEARFALFVREQVGHYLQEMRPKLNPNANTCYALEGLYPALAMTTDDPVLNQSLRFRVRAEMRKNLGFQIQPGQDRLDLGNGVYLISPRLKDFVGAFVAGRKRPETRIDFTQHCLSALIKARMHDPGGPGGGRK